MVAVVVVACRGVRVVMGSVVSSLHAAGVIFVLFVVPVMAAAFVVAHERRLFHVEHGAAP